MSETHHTRRPEGKWGLLVYWILLLLGVATLVLGIWGFTAYAPETAACGKPVPLYFFDWLYQTLALFSPIDANIRLGECYPHPQLLIARFTGIGFLGVGAVRLLLVLFRGPLRYWRLLWLSNHFVILGFGEIGQARAEEFADERKSVLVIDASPNEVLNDIAERHRILLLRGEARMPAVLRQARIDHAADVTVALGDDTQNLAAAQYLAMRWQKPEPDGRRIDVSRTSALIRHLAMRWRKPAPDNRRIEVSLTSPLIRRALNDGAEASRFDVFSVEEAAATLLCQSARFFEIADLRGQRQIHIVFVGFAPLTAVIATHILRTCAMADLGRPSLTILAPDPDGARDQLLLGHSGIDQLAALYFVRCDPVQCPFDQADRMPGLAPAPVTAIVVALPQVTANLPVALAVREAARRGGWWPVPIFLGADRIASFEGIDHRLESTRRYSDVMHSFETSAQLSTRKAGAARDRMAEAVHNAYRAAFDRMVKDGEKPSQGGDALEPWEHLRHTYKRANRRVADHLPAKLASAGCYVPHGTIAAPDGFDLLRQPGMLDRLSVLEHDAWIADRLLDGWRYGPVRDNALRLHDCLLPFDHLPAKTQELDRVQIRELNLGWLPRRPPPYDANTSLVRFDLWIGLIGHRSLTQTQADWVKDTVQGDVLPKLLNAHHDHHVSLLSPLAPGADLILTEAALAFLAANKSQHRLLVTEAVPMRDVVEDFEASWQSDAVGSLDPATRKSVWQEAREALLKRINALEAGPPCERILELSGPPSAADETLNLGYRRQNAYLVQRAHVIIAAVAGTPTPRAGGIEEALSWRRDHATIPAAMPRYLPRPNHPAAGTPGLILLDASQRTVTSEAPVG
jgi:hypothetical protein